MNSNRLHEPHTPFHTLSKNSWRFRDQLWKLVTNKDSSYVELYDMVADPYEKADLKEKNPEEVEPLKMKLSKWPASLPKKRGSHLFSSERINPTQ